VLRSIKIANFKAVGDSPLALELRPLTLLLGPNGAGKSSVLEAIALLAQSIRPPHRYGLVPHGRLARLRDDSRDLFHGRDLSRTLSIEIAAALDAPLNPELIEFGFSVSQPEDEAKAQWSQDLRIDGAGVAFVRVALGGHGYRHVARIRDEELQVSGSTSRLLDAGLFAARDKMASLDVLSVAADTLADYLAGGQLRFIGALRGAAMMQEQSQGRADAAGPFGENTVRVLSRLFGQAPKQRRKWLQWACRQFGLHDLRTGLIADNQLAVHYDDPLENTQLTVGSAGFGSQQALPILTDIADMSPGGCLLVEEIEHSSHPEWIARWGQVLAKATSELGVQVIATTHAPDLVLSVASAVKNKLLRPEDVAIYELERSAESISTSRVELGEDGHFETGWVKTFASAERELLGDLMDADD
jgi:predicted ATPase